MTFKQALAALEARQETRVELGLDRVRARLKRLGDPQEKLRVFHVAGTNGKGSTCAMLESCLRAAGLKTGLYISPHLQDVRERIQVGGRQLSKDEFARAMTKAFASDPEEKLTYFELLTLAAFVHFVDAGCDVVVLETGLGGRLDATNVVSAPMASLITSVDFDHMAFLGDTLAKIAGEKAGIAKKGVPLLCPPLKPEAMAVVRKAAEKAGAPLVVVKPWARAKISWPRAAQTFKSPIGAVEVGLLGERQGANAALVYEALRGIDVSPAAIKRGLQRVSWPARFEVRRLGGKTAILDGAHNPEAMENLARTWRASPYSKRGARWIIGVLKDKDARALLAPVARQLDEVVAVRPPSPRALEPVELARLVRAQAPRARVSVEPDAETALRRWRRESAAPRTAVVCGSFYLVGRAAKVLGGQS